MNSQPDKIYRIEYLASPAHSDSGERLSEEFHGVLAQLRAEERMKILKSEGENPTLALYAKQAIS